MASEDADDVGKEWEEKLAKLTPEEQQVKFSEWGFDDEELKTAIKVIRKLRWNPAIFLEDDVLKSTTLWRWINRPPELKDRKLDAELSKVIRKRARDSLRAEDKRKLAKTEMRLSRNAALERMLEIDPEYQQAEMIEGPQGYTLQITEAPKPKEPLRITEKGEGEGEEEGSASPSPDPEKSETENVLSKARHCYICKASYYELHNFYCSLCPQCSEFNYAKRMQTRDMKGKVVLLTGARIKIGYQIALRLLRDGAILYATTRFTKDAAKRFEQEEDYEQWKDRLHLFQLDLRDLWSVKQFCRYLLANVKCLFAIIHNAAQTIARPPEYYQNLIEGESAGGPPPAIVDTKWAEYVKRGSSFVTGVQHKLEHKTEGPDDEYIPTTEASMNVIKDDGVQQITVKPFFDMYDTMQERSDHRTKNSWTSHLHEVSAEEAAEVHAINALSPFIMNSMLKPIMVARPDNAPGEKHFIINVSAMEGQFYRYKKPTHPHTNMAKAALNMMTRTSGADYAKDGIYMNSVDTGWITDESPRFIQQRRLKTGSSVPLDEIDAAARVLDLVYIDSSEHSKFWKDFKVIPW